MTERTTDAARATRRCAGRAPCSPCVAAFADHQPGAARRRRPGRRRLGDDPVGRPRPRNRANIINNATVLYLSGARRRRRLPDEPVQHRRRRPVPRRRVRRRRGRRRGLAARLPQHRRCVVVRDGRRRALGRHRRRAAGHPRRQRGHLDDHAQRDRDLARRLPAAQGRGARGGQQLARHQARSPRAAGSPGIPFGDATSRSTASSLLAVARRDRLLVRAQPHPLRLRPPRHRHVRRPPRSPAASTSSG